MEEKGSSRATPQSSTTEIDHLQALSPATLKLNDPSLEKNQEAQGPEIKDTSSQAPDQKHFSPLRKEVILAVVASVGFLGPLSSTIYIPAILDVEKGLDTTISLVNLTISMYILFLGAGPLDALWPPSYGLFLFLRIIQAIGSSASQVIGAGVIADIFSIHDRGKRMGIFFLGPLLGPVVGPIIGGVINQHLGWRWLFWILTIVGGVFTIAIIFLLPETLANTKKLTWFNPLAPLYYFRYPAVSLAATYPAVCFGFMYLLITILPETMTELYQWNSTQVGLSFLSGGIGNVVGTLVGGRLADWTRRRGMEQGGGEAVPEHRLHAVWFGAPLVPIGFLIYGWCLQADTHFMGPLIGYFIQGVGLMIGFTVVNTYFVDVFASRAASVVGAAAFYRCVFATVTPLFAMNMEEGLGHGWTYTVIAIICALATLCIVAVVLRGQKWHP
ncbi:major facilitator superfamily domain-containing protein [Piptocephalis cylindrospora]|uniref:Major facilitator superfamily domain-containing protein n=1 Tax=Piptocephalis cylindrospora TaxID=1907219 RepID=A0A4P9Y7H0_9FUNG|nr:major facilitator superfamily domain-containing protein [Piptocephalis cylindrospora]|eukprot:RKP13850.1 major facilitator superfamily domain-containing protein [Piptocephalis cylindrospora]